MRHVPTTLYLDTNVFIRNQGVDSRSFHNLKSISNNGGLRVLFPEVTEHEISEHFPNSRPKQIEEFLKNNFAYKPLPIKPNTAEFLEDYSSIINSYANQDPSRPKGKRASKDALIIKALERYHKRNKVNIAIISLDRDFKGCEDILHFQCYTVLDDYIEAFKRGPADSDQIITEDLSEIKIILGLGDEATHIEISRVLELIQNQDERYQYFFNNAGPVWIDRLRKEGLFGNLPDTEVTSDE